MTAEALINKYRPVTLDQVLGHDAIVRALQENLKRNDVHNFLFSSTVPGTGKTTLARIMAYEFNCRGPLGLYEIDGATKNGIDDMRELQDMLRYRPFHDGNFAILVDEAHRVSAQAWDSLLKSIEEPPSWVYWFFCTTNVAKVPKSIASRCAKYDLKPLKAQDIRDLLDFIVEAEGIATIDGITALCADEALGSARDGITKLLAVSSASTLDEAATMLGTAAQAPAAIDLCRALIAGTTWKEVRGLLAKMDDVNPESIRMVILAYMSKVALGTDNKDKALQAIAVIDKFSTPFNDSERMAPLVRALGLLLFDS